MILTGAGGYFCAGADLKAMSSSSPSDRFESGEFDPSVIKSLLKGFRVTKPLIAAVEGPAIAGGTEILQATDIRVAGESARFGVSEPKWGLYPLGGSAVRLRPPDPLHGRGRPAADRTAHQGAGGQGDRADRPRRPRRRGAGQGPRDRRPDRRQRPARRAGGAQDDPRLRGQARGRVLEGRRARSAPRCSPPTTPRRARGPSPRSAPRTSPAAEHCSSVMR